MNGEDMPNKHFAEFKARVERRVHVHRAYYGSVIAVGAQLGVVRETLLRWVYQAEVDVGFHPGVTSEGTEKITQLKVENKRLHAAKEI
jgi:transposase